VFFSFSFSYFFFCCCCYYGNSNDCKTMLPHLLVLYTSYIRSRYVCTRIEKAREIERTKEKRQKMEMYSDWNKSPFCFLRSANGRVFVFRIFTSFSGSVTKDKCLFCALKLSKKKKSKQSSCSYSRRLLKKHHTMIR